MGLGNVCMANLFKWEGAESKACLLRMYGLFSYSITQVSLDS